MTICIAAMHNWLYNMDGSDAGKAILAASDRMMTLDALAMEYEPPLFKWATISPRCILMAADNITVHTELLARMRRSIPDASAVSIRAIADEYGRIHREYLAEAAEVQVLSKLRMDLQYFFTHQREMDPQQVAQLDMEIRDCQASILAQAMVVGCDDLGAHIFHIDRKGAPSCYDDVGFCCIGSGSHHANSLFAQYGYGNTWSFYNALMLVYAAKKSAEVAPGVGPQTDIAHVTRDNASMLDPATFKNVSAVYAGIRKSAKRDETRAIAKLIRLEGKTHGWPSMPAGVLPILQSPVPDQPPPKESE